MSIFDKIILTDIVLFIVAAVYLRLDDDETLAAQVAAAVVILCMLTIPVLIIWKIWVS